MDAVTYPQPEVRSLLAERFVCLKLETQSRAREIAAVVGSWPLVWTPTFFFGDRRGRFVRRTVGYLRPSHLLAELRLASGLVSLNERRPADAQADFAAACELYGESRAAAEALYWNGVAKFRLARDKRVLVPQWASLQRRFPDSAWAARAQCLETLEGIEYDATF